MKLILMKDDGNIVFGFWIYKRTLFVWSNRVTDWRKIFGRAH